MSKERQESEKVLARLAERPGGILWIQPEDVIVSSSDLHLGVDINVVISFSEVPGRRNYARRRAVHKSVGEVALLKA